MSRSDINNQLQAVASPNQDQHLTFMDLLLETNYAPQWDFDDLEDIMDGGSMAYQHMTMELLRAQHTRLSDTSDELSTESIKPLIFPPWQSTRTVYQGSQEGSGAAMRPPDSLIAVFPTPPPGPFSDVPSAGPFLNTMTTLGPLSLQSSAPPPSEYQSLFPLVDAGSQQLARPQSMQAIIDLEQQWETFDNQNSIFFPGPPHQPAQTTIAPHLVDLNASLQGVTSKPMSPPHLHAVENGLLTPSVAANNRLSSTVDDFPFPSTPRTRTPSISSLNGRPVLVGPPAIMPALAASTPPPSPHVTLMRSLAAGGTVGTARDAQAIGSLCLPEIEATSHIINAIERDQESVFDGEESLGQKVVEMEESFDCDFVKSFGDSWSGMPLPPSLNAVPSQDGFELMESDDELEPDNENVGVECRSRDSVESSQPPPSPIHARKKRVARSSTRRKLEVVDEDDAAEEERVRKLFPCDKCEKRFMRKHDMLRHKKLHEGRKVECGECGRMFARKDGLVRHLRKKCCLRVDKRKNML
ncbi:hypothetical protein HDU67_002482 [Dinochytrium kinnereticum]|nr:hypothetical protein HDU67_002482 [Dinochytrium kinnereticum]